MTDNLDVRWIQRLDNYKRAFNQLSEAIELLSQRLLSNLEKQGLIQAFEYTHELSWNLLKDFLEDRGNKGIYGSKDTVKAAFKWGLLENGTVWMQMIESRNLTSHTYDENTADKIVSLVQNMYFEEFKKLLCTMDNLSQENRNT